MLSATAVTPSQWLTDPRIKKKGKDNSRKKRRNYPLYYKLMQNKTT